ncbi:MAG: bifunctional diaminohydroxyphosphoribosylaminopyrimidine deaminase/5-amino-6-(5-phosphoribosylamino)uracil reductase RibD [Verrucomicrobiales bacterium]|nr:bifunctional diaminohydroxyphosphoribosylaminopyrimidine deaminase/5-amino-6-(5-phosphoribosylamino)uracil reductase RibD [Verrucomicrobiales bacterium]
MPANPPESDERYMRRALTLARRGWASTSPNPRVGAVLVRAGRVVGEGWHRKAGLPHAEIEAFADAASRGLSARGATLYVTLEPCCTHGRTPPCTDAIVAAGVRRVVVGATDPNPRHAGRGFEILRDSGIRVTHGVLESRASALNESFNHWIRERTPWITLKAAMTLDGKIATPTGESKWITGERARAAAMRLRAESDAILVGVNTVLADDPSLTVRGPLAARRGGRPLRRLVLDSRARTPIRCKLATDDDAAHTTVVVTAAAPRRRVEALERRVTVVRAPADPRGGVDLAWLMERLGGEGVTRLLVEGGGEVNGAFLDRGFVHRVAFFYAPKILGGSKARRAVGGRGAEIRADLRRLTEVRWTRLGSDWMLTARVSPRDPRGSAGE